MTRKDKLKEIKKIIDRSELCNLAWQYIDNGGDLTTEDGVKKANKLRDKLAKAILKKWK